jgi:hypothetical protein
MSGSLSSCFLTRKRRAAGPDELENDMSDFDEKRQLHKNAHREDFQALSDKLA